MDEQRAHGDNTTGSDGAVGLLYSQREVMNLRVAKHSVDVRSGKNA